MDTHLLLWFAGETIELTQPRRALIEDEENEVYFSAISLWEIVIKYSLQRNDFVTDAHKLRFSLLARGFRELDFTTSHAFRVAGLPAIH